MTELAPWNAQRKTAGTISQKPWHYAATATVAHLETPEALAVVLDLLRAQTARPYLLVVDTGSRLETCRQLEKLRADDCEIHYIRGHAWQHGSQVIAAANDLAMSLCRSEFLFLTQTDVFPRRRDFLADLIGSCREHPVVGYEMSPRDWATDEWQGMVGHTATMLHMPTMRRLGATWDMQRGVDALGVDLANAVNGWPDTETAFNLHLRAADVTPRLVGHDENGTDYIDANLRHCRSYTVAQVHREGHTQREWIADAIREARENLQAWEN